MQRLIRFLIISALTGFAASPAGAYTITYSYTGNDYTQYGYGNFCGCYTPFSVEDLKTAAYNLGPRMTITATLNVDHGELAVPLNGTFAGLFYFGGPDMYGRLEVNMFSGRGFALAIPNQQSITFVNGAVTAWSFTNFNSFNGFNYVASTFESSSAFGDHVQGYTGYNGAGFGADVNTSGTWSLVSASPVPGPAAGAGIPGLLMALAGFIGWRRSRRTHAIAA